MKKRLPLILGILAFCCIATVIFGALLPDQPATAKTPAPTHTPVPTQTAIPTLSPAQTYFDEYGGNIDVYNQIFSLTDCAALQQMFDQADANLKLQQPGTPQYKWGIGYMAASDQRMKDLACY